jgi:steroid delta-isomerase-like uncharacterized protein
LPEAAARAYGWSSTIDGEAFMTEQAAHSATMTEREALARRFFEDGFTEGRLEVLDDVMSDDFVTHDPQVPLRDLRGPAAARTVIQTYRGAFSDLRMSIDDVVEQRDRVAIRWTATGTHSGELNGLAATGRTVTVTGMTIQRIAGGRVAEAWSNWDTLGLLQQIGASPAPGGIAEKIGVRFQRVATAVDRRLHHN